MYTDMVATLGDDDQALSTVQKGTAEFVGQSWRGHKSGGPVITTTT